MPTTFNSLLLAGGGWHDGSMTLTYSFDASMSAPERVLMQLAVDMLNAVANINMVEAPVSVTGDLEFNSVNTGYYGYAYYPGGGVIGTPSIEGDVFISNTLSWQIVNQLGHTSWNTYLHELGHALGLSHPDEDPSNWENTPTNNNQYTMMSYIEHPSVSALPLGQQAWGLTPMIYDIQALQALYGANTSWMDGNTSYFGPGNGLGETAFQDGDMRVDINNLPMIVTIWDGGGIDVIDASIVGTNSYIDLRNEAFSTIGTTANNVSIAAAVIQGGIVVNLIENAKGGSGDDTIVGNTGANYMNGQTGDDNLKGGAGNDTLTGGSGDDVLNGGFGVDDLIGGAQDDTYLVNNAQDAVTETATGGTNDRVLTTVSYALGAGVHVETLAAQPATSTDPINLTGNALAQRIVGNQGENRLSDGGSGGIDTLVGGLGDDTYVVSNSDAVIVEDVGGGDADRVLTSVSFTLAANDAIELLSTTSALDLTAIDLTGNALAQRIVGNAGANRLSDGAVGGIDTLVGGLGDDTYVVRNAAAVIIETAGGGLADRVSAAVSYTLSASSNIEFLNTTVSAGLNNINLTGNGLDQTITGNAGANRLDGMKGADRLTGGGGADTFVFGTALSGGNIDTITDFDVAADTIELVASVFDDLDLGLLDAARFVASANGQAVDALNRILYDTTTGNLFFDADGSDTAFARIRFAVLADGLSLSETDFMVV